MKKLIPGCLFFLVFARLAAQNSTSERIYIYTDRQVYHAAGEIRFSSFTGGDPASEGLSVYLINPEGDPVPQVSVPLAQGWAGNSLVLPDSLKPGIYTLAAGKTSTSGTKIPPLWVQPVYFTEAAVPEMMLWMKLDAESYKPGEFAQLTVSVGFLNERVKFGTGDVNYFASKNGIPFQSGFDKTGETGNLSVLIRVPSTPDPGVITVNANAASGDIKGSSTILIPVLATVEKGSDSAINIRVDFVPAPGRTPPLEGIILHPEEIPQGSRLCVSVTDDIASPAKQVSAGLPGDGLFHSLYLDQGADFQTYLRKNKSKLAGYGLIPSAETSSSRVKEQLQMGIPILVVLRSVKPYILQGSMILFRGTNSLQYEKGALFVIDGVEKGNRIEVLEQYSPYDIESIRVSLETSDILKYSADGAGGIIFINTKDASGGEKQKEAATPKYNPTLYWNPDIKLNYGIPVMINLPKSSLKTRWRIDVRGVDPEGRAIRGTYFYPPKNT